MNSKYQLLPQLLKVLEASTIPTCTYLRTIHQKFPADTTTSQSSGDMAWIFRSVSLQRTRNDVKGNSGYEDDEDKEADKDDNDDQEDE